MTTPPLSDTDLVLKVLLAHKGDWVPKMYSTTGVMVHSRIADLRKRGHVIECRCFGHGDYRYRLVPPDPDQPGDATEQANTRLEREGNRLSADALAKSMADHPGDAT